VSIENDPMAEIRASFFIECEELLEALQDALQIIDDGADDAETINIVFRAVHSIKGGAGAFGLEALVRFAHRYETVLDEVRTGRLQADHDALKIFFLAADHLSDLVRISRDDAPLPDDTTARLLSELDGMLGDHVPADALDEVIEFAPMSLNLDLDLGDGGAADLEEQPDIGALLPPLDLSAVPVTMPTCYTLRFTPLAELFETGNEPFQLLRNLEDLGEIIVTCDSSDLPGLVELAPEVPHLGWTVALTTVADVDEITSIFEFVEGLCTLVIERDGVSVATMEPEAQIIPPEVKAEQPIAPAPPRALQEPQVSGSAVQQQKIAIAQKPTPEPKTAPKNAAATPERSVVRVDLDRIERLVNLVGELVINQAMLSQSLEQSGLSPHSDAMNGLEEFQRLTRDIQDSVMMIRAQPVKSLFQRMSRIVREASSAVGKEVRLHTEGEATEVDKTVIERLADPLTHMIRNAVDHGLEDRETRIAAGKPGEGRVNLSAAHRSGRVVIEVSDDGAGINRPRVLQIAIDKGLIPADAQLSDTEIDNLLFLPGFSTASVISDLSGRGVGMDVVRTAIQALGGRITTTSVPGQGTAFSISLPLTLAVLDGMVVQVADQTLVLPLNLVIETLTLTNDDVDMVRPGHNVVHVRGTFVPLFDLGVQLGYRSALENYDGCIVLLIAHEDGSRAALVIDNIQDQRQVVIKGLDDSFYRAPGIAAATILGDGQIALILDPSDIISNAMGTPGLVPPPLETGVSA